MEGETSSRWRNLKRLLSFRSFTCCGTVWSDHPDHMSLPQESPDFSIYYSQNELNVQQQQQQQQLYAEISPDLQCLLFHHDQNPQETNLASAIAAERQLRAANLLTPTARPLETISLMSLLVEKEKEERKAKITSYEEDEEDQVEEGKGSGCYCCVCMGRRKGAAFIPCGHTFCRMCARELWINRGSCPLCNRNIAEILDIF